MAQGVKITADSKKKSKENILKKTQSRRKMTLRRLKISNQRPLRNKKGKLLEKQPSALMMTSDVSKPKRVQPDRRWFGNTRVVGQNHLDEFRNAMNIESQNPFRVILKRQKLPMSLLEEPKTKERFDLLSASSFEETFGKKSTRKRARLTFNSLNSYAQKVKKSQEIYEAADQDTDIICDEEEKKVCREKIFDKGQSKRIWNELYKVIDSSDVVLQVLDARDPMGTRSKHIEKMFLKRDCHKNMAFVLNKCDLIPTWAVGRWISILSKEFPTIAFHASVKKPFGKGSLIKLLRQYAALHTHRKQISVGFIGYPNVGKSSIINALRRKKVCKVAPNAGETKVWQYVTLFQRVYLIDCPGVVSANDDSDDQVVLKSVVRIEKVDSPEQYIPSVLRRVKAEHLRRAYGDFEWSDAEDFLKKFAEAHGKLLKGGEPDLNNCAKMVLHDWQRGKLPWFVEPPAKPDEAKLNEAKLISKED